MSDYIRRLTGGKLGAVVARALGRSPSSIWCLHRFIDGNDPWTGDDVGGLAQQIRTLAARGVRFVPLADLETSPDNAAPRVAITIDDGYKDFETHAWPMFQSLRCPVTVYVTTAPVTEGAWFWWDLLEHALDQTTKDFVDVDELSIRVALADPLLRRKQSLKLRDALKQLPDEERRAVISRLTQESGLADSVKPPAHMRALDPGGVEKLAKEGVDFGAHTVTHPILSRCQSQHARWEIAESVRTVAALTGRAVTSFAYPNGASGDFGEREIAEIRAQGVPVAVTTTPRILTAEDDPMRKPRFIYSQDAYAMGRRALGFSSPNDEH